MSFTCEELGYLDSKSEAQARRARNVGGDPSNESGAVKPLDKTPRARTGRTGGQGRSSTAN